MPVSQRSRPSQRPLGPLDRIPAQPQPTGFGAAHREEAPLPVDEEGGVGGCGLTELQASGELGPFLTEADEGRFANEDMTTNDSPVGSQRDTFGRGAWRTS